MQIFKFDTVHKTLYSVKPLRSIFDKVDEYIVICDGTKYLALFSSDEKYWRMFNRVRYLIC